MTGYYNAQCEACGLRWYHMSETEIEQAMVYHLMNDHENEIMDVEIDLRMVAGS